MINNNEMIIEFIQRARSGGVSKKEIAEKIIFVKEILDRIDRDMDHYNRAAFEFDRATAKNNIIEINKSSEQFEDFNERMKDFAEKQNFWMGRLKDLEKLYFEEKNFNKLLCLSNIRELLSSKPNVKIGQIEKDAGCQPGYMSRLEKSGNVTDPTIEFVVTAAKELGVTIDFLVNSMVGKISSTEEYLIKFINHLNKDTQDDSIVWNLENSKILGLVDVMYSTTGETNHPLFSSSIERGDVGESNEKIHYESRFFPTEEINIVGNSYNAQLPGTDARIYIMRCSGTLEDRDTVEEFYEVYLYTGKKLKPLFSSLKTCGLVVNELENLCNEIEVASSRVHIDEEAKNIIDDFIEFRDMPF